MKKVFKANNVGLITFWNKKWMAFIGSRSSLQKKVISGGFWATTVKGVSMPLNLAVVGLLARLMTPEEMGLYFLIFSLVTAAASLGMLGMGQTMVRLVASSIAIEDYESARSAMQESFAWGFLGAALISLLIYFFAPYFGLPKSIILWVSAWCLIQTGQNLLSEALRGLNDIRTATIFQNRTITNAFVSGILFAFLTFNLKLDLKLAINIIVFISSCAVFIGLILVWKKLNIKAPTTLSSSTHKKRMRIFSQALPIFGISAMNIVRAQIGIWIIAIFLSSEEVALYGSATRLVYIVSVPLMMIVNALIPPIIAELFAKQQIAKLEQTVRGLATVASVAALAFTIFFIAGGNVILELIYGEFYKNAWLVLSILAVGQLTDVISGSGGLTLTMTGYQRILMKITIITATFAVIITLTGAYFWGMVGVAIATALSLMVQNILMVLQTKSKVGIWTHASFNWKNLGLKNAS